jgi:hypothetical protein
MLSWVDRQYALCLCYGKNRRLLSGFIQAGTKTLPPGGIGIDISVFRARFGIGEIYSRIQTRLNLQFLNL